MTAANSDRVTKRRDPQYQAYGVTAAGVIYAGTLVCLALDGYADAGADTAGFKFVGVSRAAADNSDGADGDINVEVDRKGVFRMGATGLAATDVSRKVYLVDDQTVGTIEESAVDNNVYVGILREYVSATEGWVEIDPDGKGVEQFTVEVTGVNAAAFDLATEAAAFGGGDFYVLEVDHIEGFVTATGTSAGRQIVTTDWTLAAGVLSTVGNETANTWVITFKGELLPS
jgi:hypothetical protein